MRVRITRIDPELPLPEYATSGAAGFDLYCRLDVTVRPQQIELIPANVVIAVPPGFALIVCLRSSTPRRTGLVAPHGIGIIDSDYRGPYDEVQIQVYNPGEVPVLVRRGDRIAQALLVRADRIQWDEGEPDRLYSRGGFGSTG